MPDTSAAAGAGIPWLPIAQGVFGLAQSLIGGGKAKKAQKQLENLATPEYTQNQSILDYYNKALARYDTSPTDSALYKRSMNNTNRSTANAINALQDRRAGLIGIPSILRAQNDAMLNAELAAEGEKNNRFAQLGSATNAKANEDRTAFQYNEVAPYEKKYNLLAAKAGANNQIANTGIGNIFGGLSSLNDYNLYKKMYGVRSAGSAVGKGILSGTGL